MEQKPLTQTLAKIEPSDGVSANVILTEFYLGRRSLSELSEPLCSNDDRAVRHAVWITSELGPQARPLLGHVQRLLRHPSPYIRQMALETVFLCSTSEHGHALAAGLTLLCDESPNVRKRAYFYCARTATEKLNAGINLLPQESATEYSPLLKALAWLLSPAASDPVQVNTMVMDSDPTNRTLGILGAARLGQDGVGLLKHADPNSDEALAAFLRDRLST